MNTAATAYTIRVDGHLEDHWSAWLGEVDMTRHDDGTTTLTVEVADQAQLQEHDHRVEQAASAPPPKLAAP